MAVVVDRSPVKVLDAAWKYYKPSPRILQAWAARYRETVLEGPADTGKSRGWLEYIHQCAMKYAGMRAAIIRKTRNSLTTTACVTYEKFVRPDGVSHLWHDSEYRYANGSKLILLGMDDPDKVLSSEYDLAYVQEASEITEEDWEVLTTRVTGRGAVMPYTRIVADMNPTHPDFWLYKREERGDTHFIAVTHEDNPTITPERLAALDALTGYRYKRLRLGLRVAAEGMYFTEWNPDVHICEPFEIPATWARWGAVDYGFDAPWCTLWFARDPANKHRIYLYREQYARGLRDEQQAEAIVRVREAPGIPLWADPSMFSERREQNKPSIAKVYAQHGVGLLKASNNRITGWQACRRVLAIDPAMDSPRLQVLRDRAPNFVRTLPAMVHDPLDSEDLADKIKSEKTEDHAVDAWRYAMVAEAIPVHERQAHDWRMVE